MLLKTLKIFRLIILAGNIAANFGEFLKLLFDFFRGCLDILFDTLEVFVMGHLCPGVSDDVNVFRKEFISVLVIGQLNGARLGQRIPTKPNRAGNYGALISFSLYFTM
jgi:hypothetical protein